MSKQDILARLRALSVKPPTRNAKPILRIHLTPTIPTSAETASLISAIRTHQFGARR